MDNKKEGKYFHICLNVNSTIVMKLKVAKIEMGCLTYEELLQKMWNIGKNNNSKIKEIDEEYSIPKKGAGGRVNKK